MSKQSHATGTLPTNGYVRQSQLVPHIIPFSPATLWRKVKTGLFPRPVKLSERVTAWAVEDVRAWMQQQSPGVAKTVKRTQSRERTNTIVLSLNGVIRPLVAWAEDRGVNPSVMRRRKTLGWSDDEIIVGERSSPATQLLQDFGHTHLGLKILNWIGNLNTEGLATQESIALPFTKDSSLNIFIGFKASLRIDMSLTKSTRECQAPLPHLLN